MHQLKASYPHCLASQIARILRDILRSVSFHSMKSSSRDLKTQSIKYKLSERYFHIEVKRKSREIRNDLLDSNQLWKITFTTIRLIIFLTKVFKISIYRFFSISPKRHMIENIYILSFWQIKVFASLNVLKYEMIYFCLFYSNTSHYFFSLTSSALFS